MTKTINLDIKNFIMNLFKSHCKEGTNPSPLNPPQHTLHIYTNSIVQQKGYQIEKKMGFTLLNRGLNSFPFETNLDVSFQLKCIIFFNQNALAFPIECQHTSKVFKAECRGSR